MGQWIVWVLDILLYLAEGYCIQFFFGRFAKPKLHGLKYAEWASGITWIAVRAASEGLFLGMGGGIRFLKLLVSSMVLFVFCMCWYQGNLLLKIFLAVQFAALRELSFWASSSLLFLGNGLITLLAHGADSGWLPIGWLVPAVSLVSYVSVALEWAVQGLLLFVSVRRIAACYQGREEGWMGKEVFLYLLPAAAGLLVDLLVSLLIITAENGETVILYEKYPFLYILVPMLALSLILAVVFSFQTFQELAALQEGRAEKIILEHQITQMQEAMAELEHMYDGVRAVRHDMKNHMNILSYHLEQGENQKALTYLSEIQSHMDQSIKKTVSVNHEIVDAILSQMQSESERQKIRWEIEGSLPADLPVGDFDLCTIFSNLLSNSIEACTNVEESERSIYLAIRRLGEQLVIEVENSSSQSVEVGKLGNMTSKKDVKNHGYGILNIKDAVRKNHGEILFESLEGRFAVRIIFPLSEKATVYF